MAIYQVEKTELSKVVHLFEGYEETMVWSCLQGCMGSVWVDSLEHITSAQLVIADFCFFGGVVSKELVLHHPVTYDSEFVIMVPTNKEWEACIEQCYEERARKVTRYAMKKDACFHRDTLTTVVEQVNPSYTLHRVDQELFDRIREERWSKDLCNHFTSYEEYEAHGIGVVAKCEENIVSGASSYTYYRGGIEIEIDTLESYRRQGLALACGAKLILSCLDRGWYPSWDAQNIASVKLAMQLGYTLDYEYSAYEVMW